MDLAFFSEVFVRLLGGVPLTLQLAGISVAAGLVLAVTLALALQTGNSAVTWPIKAYVTVFRGTPLLVQIFLIYYGLGQFRPSLQAMGLWGFFREPYWCAILALTLNTAAYGAEIIRGGLQSVPCRADRGGAGVRHVALPGLSAGGLPDRAAPGAAELRQ